GPRSEWREALFEVLVDPLLGWNIRAETFVIGGVIVAATICALWLKKRLCANLSVFDAAILAILFTTAQWQTLFMTPNFAHGPFPLLLLLLYCISWSSKTQAVRYPLLLFVNFVTIYTGFGVFLVVLTSILLILDYCTGTPQILLSLIYFMSA